MEENNIIKVLFIYNMWELGLWNNQGGAKILLSLMPMGGRNILA